LRQRIERIDLVDQCPFVQRFAVHAIEGAVLCPRKGEKGLDPARKSQLADGCC
jgi:hypothetical protein